MSYHTVLHVYVRTNYHMALLCATIEKTQVHLSMQLSITTYACIAFLVPCFKFLYLLMPRA